MHPQMLVAGNDAWQYILIEERTRRAVILVGDVVEEFDHPTRHVLGAWRNGVDIVVGTRDAIDSLRAGSWNRLAPSVSIVLDADGPNAAPSQIDLGLGQSIRIGAIHLDIRALPTAGPDGIRSWIGHLRVGSLVVAIAPTLEAIGAHADPATALMIAPAGQVNFARSRLPSAVAAVNAWILDDQPGATDGALVRVFPTEVARFEFAGGRLRLPSWATGVVSG